MNIDHKMSHLCFFFHRKLDIDTQNLIYNKVMVIEGYQTPPSSPRTTIPGAPMKKR